MKASIRQIDPASYENHALHRGERAWLETNCYVDLWIEALHAFGFDPAASLAFTVALDFEGDQWLFFKQPTSDLYELYGVDVQELCVWRSLSDQVAEQVARGRLVLVEVDAFWLPDTAGVSYRTVHTKSTIGIQAIDTDARKLGYFHNAGYFALEGEDFAQTFGLDRERRPDELVPYTEFARMGDGTALGDRDLLARSRAQLSRHVARRPRHNPVASFRTRFLEDVPWLQAQPQEMFHLYAFSTLRQCGACYELAGSYMRWLAERGVAGLEPAAEAFDTLAREAKTMQFKAARAVVLKRPVAFTPMLDAMEQAWERAMTTLIAAV